LEEDEVESDEPSEGSTTSVTESDMLNKSISDFTGLLGESLVISSLAPEE